MRDRTAWAIGGILFLVGLGFLYFSYGVTMQRLPTVTGDTTQSIITIQLGEKKSIDIYDYTFLGVRGPYFALGVDQYGASVYAEIWVSQGDVVLMGFRKTAYIVTSATSEEITLQRVGK
jgi:hypothetical protein